VRLRRSPAHARPLAAVDDEEDEDVGDDLEDFAPSVEPPSPLEPGVDFFSDEPDDSEPDEDADDLAAFRLSVL
jgi:hypothetical protein